MALTVVRKRSELGDACVLAPERYDPRRSVSSSSSPTLGNVVDVVRGTVQPGSEVGACLVLDTSDAREGIVISRHEAETGAQLGSAKKTVRPGDVIISRLRPYLRQVAFVDRRVPHAAKATIVCSTEFYVLRSKDRRSIAFLVPFFLCERVQEVLAAAQEGGHHPRFSEATLMALAVPESLLETRDVVSRTVESVVRSYRDAEKKMHAATSAASAAITNVWDA
jgi:hypothetical protein